MKLVLQGHSMGNILFLILEITEISVDRCRINKHICKNTAKCSCGQVFTVLSKTKRSEKMFSSTGGITSYYKVYDIQVTEQKY